jgi:hypothetical protein
MIHRRKLGVVFRARDSADAINDVILHARVTATAATKSGNSTHDPLCVTSSGAEVVCWLADARACRITNLHGLLPIRFSEASDYKRKKLHHR